MSEGSALLALLRRTARHRAPPSGWLFFSCSSSPPSSHADRAERPACPVARRGAVRAFRLPLAGAGQVRARRPSRLIHGRGSPSPWGWERWHLAPHRTGRRFAGRLPRRRRRPDLHRVLRRPPGVPGDPARDRDRRRSRPVVRKRPVRPVGPRVGRVRPGDPLAGALGENEGVRRVGPCRGLLPARLLLRHILPNAISPILVEATFGSPGPSSRRRGSPSWDWASRRRRRRGGR